ncbi:MAG: 2-oxoacid:acceptor oxidoreductase subunit alpha [Bacteroidetes bacterium]|nr:2-oxoacid:acceptor oxidoreductase subunit alpha [Bacteroidota bacterium]MCL5739166.1 2-oxoacid:acceptor oxidoreductase subunit alpha [Bacteroidota bacterium]
MSKTIETLDDVVIRFAGDSGDGMQLTGTQFTNTTALVGNDLSTLPDYPAEIRAPAGTLFGVSSFQLHFSSMDILTPGDYPDVLVAMNPAALKVHLKDLKKGGLILVNTDSFDDKNLNLAGYKTSPLTDGSLSNFQVIEVPVTKLTLNALQGMGLSQKVMVRCKNFFALGLMYWLYSRPTEPTEEWVHEKFGKEPELAEANIKALKAGYYYGETTEAFTSQFEVKPAQLKPGLYRNITGNEATALGVVAAAQKAGIPLYYASYPITPASDILHNLSAYKNFGVKTYQAEDEIAAAGAAVGASYAGNLAVTGTSGPGAALKSETISLGIMLELPLVIVDVQRGGPSTGLPTKTEQSDLMFVTYGRHGEAPAPVIAAATPADCFAMAYEAARIAVKYMTPVYLLTDGYLANGSEPWLVPDAKDLPAIPVSFRTDPENFHPYSRNENNVRPWALPGTPGLEHRIGGLEKANITGNVSYDPDNHDAMVHLRAEKVAGIAKDIPLQDVYGEQSGELLVVSWGGTFGAVRSSVDRLRKKGYKISHAHLRYLNPFPRNLGDVLKNFKKIFVPEINLGQLSKLLKTEYLTPVIQFNKVRGLPLRSTELEQAIINALGGAK